MCLGGGGGSSAPKTFNATKSNGEQVQVEGGLPQEAIDKGITTMAGWQMDQQKTLSDASLAQQKQISDQQLAFNQQQLQDQRDQQALLQKQADDQAARQNAYDTGRSSLLAEGTQRVSDAFSKFSPDYFNQYAQDYMTKASSDINYQKALAQKNLLFGLARQGLSSSQAGVDQEGLLEEKAGQATAQQTQNAADAADALKTKVAAARNALLGQVQTAESLSPPIAGTNDQSISSALDTSRNAITGVSNTAGDTVATLGGVPTVSPLMNIFSGVLGGAGSFLSGNQASNVGAYYNAFKNAGLGATNPSATTSVTIGQGH